jgi:putative ABC transport system substrate-binding protein
MWYSAVGCIGTLILSLLMAPLAARAQPAGKVWRIGYLVGSSASINEAFRQGLRDLGYVEGQNIAFAYRSADGKLDRLPDLAAELVRLPVDVLVTQGTPATLAAKAATSTLPIVFTGPFDPDGYGLIASWAQPGGNITGAAGAGMEYLTGKLLELLKEVVPAATRMAVLRNPDFPLRGEVVIQHLQAAARQLGIDLHLMQVRDSATELEGAFAALAHERVDALVGLVAALTRHRTRIVELVAASRLPAIYVDRSFVEAGGLMSYADDLDTRSRHTAIMVGKILGGAKPADIPAEYPTKFHLVINPTATLAEHALLSQRFTGA